MTTFFILLSFLAVPSFAKFVWKTDETMMEIIGERLKGTEYDIYGRATVLDLGTYEPDTGKMIALCQTTFGAENKQKLFYYLPMVIDAAEENINFCSGSSDFSYSELAKLDAETYSCNPFAFKYVWQRTSYYYKLFETDPKTEVLYTLKPLDLNSAYGISDPTVIMAYKTEDGRLGLIHSMYRNKFSFTVRLHADGGLYEVIHDSATDKKDKPLYNVQQELCAYLQVPVQWAEPWREGIQDLRKVFIEGDILKLVSQLQDETRNKLITLEKAKRVRTDLSKIAVFCREQSTMIPILALVTAIAVGDKTFDLNYIYIPDKPADDEFIEKKLQKYLTKEAFPLTNAWESVTDSSDFLTAIKDRVKDELVSREIDVKAFKVVETRNVGSAYTQKAAILRLETVKVNSLGDGYHMYVAWNEGDGILSIKVIGHMVIQIDDAENEFNFYGISPLAYSEIKFENNVGWYSNEQVPKY